MVLGPIQGAFSWTKLNKRSFQKLALFFAKIYCYSDINYTKKATLLLPDNIDLNDIHIFVKVTGLGSFTKAGAFFCLPPSSISRKVQRLEDRLGMRLLERSTRSLRLTPAGKRFFECVEAGLEEMVRGVHLLQRAGEEPAGRLRLSVPVLLGQLLFSELAVEFMECFPKVYIAMELSNRKIDLIHEDFDAAIRVGTLQDSTLVARKLGSIHMGLFAAKSYLEVAGFPKHPNDLVNHAILDLNPGWEQRRLELEHLDGTKASVKIRPRLSTSEVRAVLSASRKGLGISKLPIGFAEEHLDRNQHIRILPNWLMPAPPVHALFPHFRSTTPTLKSFLDFVTIHLKKSPVLRPPI